MRKSGFTLAEILITLGIIGVVAALTAPALIKNTSGAKVGPALAKVVGTIEAANEQLMMDNYITDLGREYGNNKTAYFEDLSKYIKKSSYDSTKSIDIYEYNANHRPTKLYDIATTGVFTLPEGMCIYASEPNVTDKPYGSLKGYFLEIFAVDIDGAQAGNNMLGDDVFAFCLDRSGVLVPIGGNTGVKAYNNGNRTAHWSNTGNYRACNATSVGSGVTCSGSIFENNLKVIYQ